MSSSKIPESFELGPHVITVRIVQNLGDARGLWSPDENLILIEQKDNAVSMRQTFFHEVLHAIGDIYQTNVKHVDIDRIAMALVQMENSSLFDLCLDSLP